MAQFIPRGYHFTPTDEELIIILINFVQEKQLQSIPIVEKVVYGENSTPWHIFFEDDPWQPAEGEAGKHGTKKIIYVLTRLSKISLKKISRRAGCGTWSGQTAGRDVKSSNGRIIGMKKMLTFEVRGDVQKEMGHWTMHEYALAGESLENVGSDDGYVICKITRDYSKLSKRKNFGNPTNYPVLGKRRKTEAIGEENTTKQYSGSNTESIAVEALLELSKTEPFVADYSGGQIRDDVCARSVEFLPNHINCDGHINDSHHAEPLAGECIAEADYSWGQIKDDVCNLAT